MEQTAQYKAGQLTTAPLGVLVPAREGNARKKKRTRERIRRMAASIHMHGGVLQKLVVVAEEREGRPTGRLEVIAGETRRLGLCALRDGWIEGASGYTNDFPVPVLVRERGEATAASTTENIEREDMHPADQFVAFQKMVEECGSVEEIAAMFGVTPLVVKRRLKLANAAPALLELYRQDGMSLDQLMALCLTDDQQAQLRVWEAAKDREWERSPERLRQAITASEVSLDSPLARFVGLKAYEAAGGSVRTDLFSDRGEGFITDSALLLQLAQDRLEARAAKVRSEGWNWVEARTELPYHELCDFGRATKGRRALSAAEQAEWDRLTAEATGVEKQIEALYDDADDQATETTIDLRQLQKKLTELRATMRRFDEKYAAWTSDVLTFAGAIVTVDRSGDIVVHRGLVRPRDRKAASKAMSKPTAASADGSDIGQTSVDKPEGEGRGLSEALMRRLTAHRTIALQRMLADNTQVALAALAHALVQGMLSQGYVRSALGIRSSGCAHELSRADEELIQDCRAWQELAHIQHAWGDRIPGDPSRLLAWLIALPTSELCDLLALCTALTVNTVMARQGQHDGDQLAAAVGLDMADWWEPSGMNYLRHVPKSQVLEAVTQAVSAEAAAALAKLKKDELVVQAETLIAGRRWLPQVLRPPAS